MSVLKVHGNARCLYGQTKVKHIKPSLFLFCFYLLSNTSQKHYAMNFIAFYNTSSGSFKQMMLELNSALPPFFLVLKSLMLSKAAII